MQTERVQIYLAPVDLTLLMPSADWLIYHAGSGMASQALVCGKPSILIPTHYEQLFTAEALAARHLGYVLNPIGRLRAWRPACGRRLPIAICPSNARPSRAGAITLAG